MNPATGEPYPEVLMANLLLDTFKNGPYTTQANDAEKSLAWYFFYILQTKKETSATYPEILNYIIQLRKKVGGPKKLMEYFGITPTWFEKFNDEILQRPIVDWMKDGKTVADLQQFDARNDRDPRKPFDKSEIPLLGELPWFKKKYFNKHNYIQLTDKRFDIPNKEAMKEFKLALDEVHNAYAGNPPAMAAGFDKLQKGHKFPKPDLTGFPPEWIHIGTKGRPYISAMNCQLESIPDDLLERGRNINKGTDVSDDDPFTNAEAFDELPEGDLADEDIQDEDDYGKYKYTADREAAYPDTHYDRTTGKVLPGHRQEIRDEYYKKQSPDPPLRRPSTRKGYWLDENGIEHKNTMSTFIHFPDGHQEALGSKGNIYHKEPEPPKPEDLVGLPRAKHVPKKPPAKSASNPGKYANLFGAGGKFDGIPPEWIKVGSKGRKYVTGVGDKLRYDKIDPKLAERIININKGTYLSADDTFYDPNCDDGPGEKQWEDKDIQYPAKTSKSGGKFKKEHSFRTLHDKFHVFGTRGYFKKRHLYKHTRKT